MTWDPEIKMYREEKGWLRDFANVDWKTATDEQVIALGKTLDFKERGLSYPECECLVKSLNYWEEQNKRPIRILETGMGWATSTRIFIAWILKHAGELNTVEKFHREKVQERMEEYGYWKHFNYILGQSLEIKWDKPIDFLFLDSGHTIETCFGEYKKYRPFLTEKGIIGFHDVRLPSIEQVIAEIHKLEKLTLVCGALESIGISFFKLGG